MKSKKVKQNSFFNLFFPVLTQQQLKVKKDIRREEFLKVPQDHKNNVIMKRTKPVVKALRMS